MIFLNKINDKNFLLKKNVKRIKKNFMKFNFIYLKYNNC